MEFELKPMHAESIEKSLGKAHRYRLLNEPMHAESICLDVLAIDPDNQHALNILLLALTDQFEQRLSERYRKALEIKDRLDDPYRRVYYDGLICERRGLALFERGGPGAGYVTYDWLRRAMDFYEAAEKISPEGNDDAILRWNTCARIIMRNPEVQPEPVETGVSFLE